MERWIEKNQIKYFIIKSIDRFTRGGSRIYEDLKEQLDTASPAKKSKLIESFGMMLDQIGETSSDAATQRWVGRTLTSMGESLMAPGQRKATGKSADLMNQAVKALKGIEDNDDVVTAYLLGRAQRFSGDYKNAINTFDKLLQKKPVMQNYPPTGLPVNYPPA